MDLWIRPAARAQSGASYCRDTIDRLSARIMRFAAIERECRAAGLPDLADELAARRVALIGQRDRWRGVEHRAIVTLASRRATGLAVPRRAIVMPAKRPADSAAGTAEAER